MDQKDKQAAIKSCNDRIKSITSVPDYQPGKRQRKRAIELEYVKIAALAPPTQEQMERAWGSEWETVGICAHKPYRLENLDKWQKYGCKKCGYSAGRKRLSFCPSCGAAMTPEAMEIVRKRLEEMDNGENN